mmetsp:Transcript_26717/g.67975  ORF Transcript_26717/g.67975 Transcript_26717/m.67975 type:complete len:98 (+) Transcript_26717:2252-2545(+)
MRCGTGQGRVCVQLWQEGASKVVPHIGDASAWIAGPPHAGLPGWLCSRLARTALSSSTHACALCANRVRAAQRSACLSAHSVQRGSNVYLCDSSSCT